MRNRQRGFTLVEVMLVVVVLVLILGVGIYVVRKNSTPNVSYTAWVASSAEQTGCLGQRGLYTELDATVKDRSKVKQIAEANIPDKVSVRTDKGIYSLTLDLDHSIQGNGQIGWAFKPVSLNEQTALSLVKTKASITYKVKGKQFITGSVGIQDGACKSLI